LGERKRRGRQEKTKKKWGQKTAMGIIIHADARCIELGLMGRKKRGQPTTQRTGAAPKKKTKSVGKRPERNREKNTVRTGKWRRTGGRKGNKGGKITVCSHWKKHATGSPKRGERTGRGRSSQKKPEQEGLEEGGGEQTKQRGI